MMHRIIAAALVAAAPPLAAGADTCPTSADMTDGVVLSMNDGSFAMTSRKTDVGIEVTSTSLTAGNDPFVFTATFAHPLALPLQAPGSDPTQILYGSSVMALNDLPATRVWTSDLQFVSGGATQATGTQTSTLTGFGALAIGACTYDVWRVRRDLAYADGFAMYSEHVYSPELGIILGETTLDENGNPRAALFFDRIAAE